MPATPTVTPASLLLEVTTEGGFIAPSAHLGQLPDVVVDTDGNIYTADSSDASTLIPRAIVRNVGAAGAAQILAAMKSANLDAPVDNGGGPGNPDAGVTVFTAEFNGNEVVSRISGGGAPGPGHPGASSSPALDLLSRLLNTAETWGAADVQTASFSPTAYKIYVAPVDSGTPSVDWPLAASLADFGTPAQPDFGVAGLRTGAVEGADAAKVASLASTPQDTFVTSNGKVFQVWIRPLLPPELN